MGARSFDALVDEAERAPIEGWDFSWLDGRATEERPSWRYSERVADAGPRRVEDAGSPVRRRRAAGEAAAAPAAPGGGRGLRAERRGRGAGCSAARRARRGRARRSAGGAVRRCDTFDLVTSRHPVRTWWDEIARVLRPGGTYLSQQVGPDSVRELSEAIMGPWPPGSDRDPEQARRGAEARRPHRGRPAARTAPHGLLRHRRGRLLPAPGDLDRARVHRGALPRASSAPLHEQIERDGEFVAHASRFLIEAQEAD